MERIKKIAERYRCTLTYLFGSQAQRGIEYLNGKDIVYDRFSDLDIAVSFETAPDDIDIYESIYKEFSELFEPFDIDLVFIHEVDTLFCYEIIKGIRIYEKSEGVADRFEEGILKMASDLSFKKKVFDREVMEAIEDGYFQFEYNPNS
ncbi:MAG: nucleotidyltransferase domain-containing protein [Deltaproteobacteria bacterium]|nr:nucleotidyltransferase domain-containing protein [Deltaproteobacteria bacterium]MCL5276473.1 nucleotidyltransferase domain-containing protein [Deltaproteobacteria bacterium]